MRSPLTSTDWGNTMRLVIPTVAFAAGLLARATSVSSQTFESNDPVIQRIWVEGKDKSQLYPLAQALLDSIGPRLTGSTEQEQANDWALALYRKWGIPVRTEQYGTWMVWRRGIAHIDLSAPRIRPLDGMLSTWSPGTNGTVEGPVVLFPKIDSTAAFEAWLPQGRGKFLLKPRLKRDRKSTRLNSRPSPI